MFWTKLWTWLKRYWYIPLLIVYTLVMYFVLRRDANTMTDILNDARDGYRKEIEALMRAREEERERHAQITAEYELIIMNLRKQYIDEKEELSKKEKKQLENYVKMYYNRPNELKRILEEKYGLTYVEPKDELNSIINDES